MKVFILRKAEERYRSYCGNVNFHEMSGLLTGKGRNGNDIFEEKDEMGGSDRPPFHRDEMSGPARAA